MLEFVVGLSFLLLTITKGFNFAHKMGDEYLFYEPDIEKREKTLKFYEDLKKKYPDYELNERMLTAEEQKIMDDAFDLFKKYFHHLWD